MKKWSVGLAVLAFVLVPQALLAQDAEEEGAMSNGIVAMSTFKVPFGEDRAKVMQGIETIMLPQEKANPNVLAFYVLTHFYGADSRDVILVRVYRDWNSVEAPCGEPCQTWWEANQPAEGTPEREEWDDLIAAFSKYYAKHSDELYSADMSLAKN